MSTGRFDRPKWGQWGLRRRRCRHEDEMGIVRTQEGHLGAFLGNGTRKHGLATARRAIQKDTPRGLQHADRGGKTIRRIERRLEEVRVLKRLQDRLADLLDGILVATNVFVCVCVCVGRGEGAVPGEGTKDGGGQVG